MASAVGHLGTPSSGSDVSGDAYVSSAAELLTTNYYTQKNPRITVFRRLPGRDFQRPQHGSSRNNWWQVLAKDIGKTWADLTYRPVRWSNDPHAVHSFGHAIGPNNFLENSYSKPNT